MRKSLIIDWLPFEVSPKSLNESVSSGGPLVVKGVLQRSNAQNHNGRIYPHEVLKREADNYLSTFVAERRAYGELDHPDSSVISLKNASHVVTDMHWEGEDLVGTCEILSTPAGNILTELFKRGLRVGISSRGMGSVIDRGDGVVVVQDDFELLGFDFVSSPSTHGAFLTPTKSGGLNESVNKEQQIINPYSNIESLIHEILAEV
jgi:hypothetical protein